MPNFVSVAPSIAELARGEKSRTQSLSQSPSLFDVPLRNQIFDAKCRLVALCCTVLQKLSKSVFCGQEVVKNTKWKTQKRAFVIPDLLLKGRGSSAKKCAYKRRPFQLLCQTNECAYNSSCSPKMCRVCFARPALCGDYEDIILSFIYNIFMSREQQKRKLSVRSVRSTSSVRVAADVVCT